MLLYVNFLAKYFDYRAGKLSFLWSATRNKMNNYYKIFRPRFSRTLVLVKSRVKHRTFIPQNLDLILQT